MAERRLAGILTLALVGEQRNCYYPTAVFVVICTVCCLRVIARGASVRREHLTEELWDKGTHLDDYTRVKRPRVDRL